MARVIYGSKAIVPAPLVVITKDYVKTGDGTKIGVLYTISLDGFILPFRGSPNGTFVSPEDAFWTLSGAPPDESFGDNDTAFSSLIKKQEALRHLFSEDGQSLEMYAGASPAIIRCNPRVVSVEFQQGQWVDRIPYTITLESDRVFIAGLSTDTEDTFEVELIDAGQENWAFEEVVGQVGSGYTVSHTISAHGIVGYDETGLPFSGYGEVAGGEAWKHAKTWCDNRVVGTVDPNIMFAILGVSGLIGGAYVKSSSLGELDGEYSITEEWVLSSTNYFIEKSFSYNKTTDGVVNINYQGKIIGLSEGEVTGGPLAIINAKSAIPTNVQAKAATEGAIGFLMGSFVLGVAPSDKKVSIDNETATINFSFGWTADEDEDGVFKRSCDASLSFNLGDSSYILNYSCDIDGKGETTAEKLANAKLGILNETDARIAALSLIGDQLPTGVIISTQFQSRSVSINETKGSVKFSYTWRDDDNQFGKYEISVDIGKSVV